jgi:hypothetical protein
MTELEDYVIRGLRLIRVSNSMTEKVRRQLRKLTKDIRAEVSRSGSRNLVATAVQAMIIERYASLAESVKGDLTQLSGIERNFMWRVMGVKEGDIGTLVEAVSALLIQGSPIDEHWKLAAAQTSMQIGAAIRQSALSSNMNGFVAIGNAMNRAAVRAASLVDASVHSTITNTRVRAVRDSPQKIDAFRWHSILDARVCPNCGIRSEKLYTVGFEPIGHKLPMMSSPPLHPYCRCILLPVVFKDGKPPRADNSRFDRWLAGKPRDFQDDILGVGRTELYKSGKMSLTDLIDQTGLFMSLKQLEVL